MICAACKAGQHPDCPSTTWCDCQHRTDRTPAVLLGVHAPLSVCTCLEHVDQARGRVAVPPPAGCPEHGYFARWVGAVAEPGLEE